MIIAFIGTVGSGKTLSAVYECYKYYRQGKRVFSNIHLKFPHIQLTFKRLMEMIRNKEELQDAVIFLDEVHIFIDARSSMKKRNKLVSYFILQTRKRNVRLLYTTQHLAQAEKRLRDTTDIICFCKNISDKTSLVNNPSTPLYIQQEYVMQWDEGVPPQRKIIIGNPVFPLYDTKQMIDDFDDDEE